MLEAANANAKRALNQRKRQERREPGDDNQAVLQVSRRAADRIGVAVDLDDKVTSSDVRGEN